MNPPVDDPSVYPRDDAPAVRYGSAMLRRFGWFYRVLGLGWALDRVRFEDHAVEQIREAEQRGPVVYVLLRRSVIDHLALNTVLNRRRLPRSRWANGVTSFWWQPVTEAWRELGARLRAWWRHGSPPDPVASGWLARAVAAGTTTTVFLEEAGGLPPSPDADPLRALIEAQGLTDRPVQIVPILVVWHMAPGVDTARRGAHDDVPAASNPAADFLLGGLEDPGLLRRLTSLYLDRGKGAFVQAGDAVDLAEFLRRTDGTSTDSRLQRLRPLLRRFLRRESRVVRGPTLLPWADMKRKVLDNPPMRAFAGEEALRLNKSEPAVQALMSREYDKIAARFSFAVIRLASMTMGPLWNRVYSGYDIRPEDLERLRAAARHGAPVLVPCHKSHFDYLLMSWVCFYGDIIVPHVVAGMNLAIWPVSIFLRAAGGFFIKRSFSGERIHPVVFSRYLRELLDHGYPVEFFIEGGRTRTGALLRPRLGVLGMVMDAAAKASPDHQITLLPISIVYEQVAEQGSYRKELSGAEKEAESVSQLVRARSVLYRRFGRIFIRVGEPIVANEITRQLPDWASATDAERKPILQAVGERIVHRIGRVTVVLPTMLVATSLLAHPRQGITHADLLARATRLRAFLARAGALEADTLRSFDAALQHALERFVAEGHIRAHVQDGDRIWQIIPEHRVALDFHKNQLLLFFAPAGLAAAAWRGLGLEEPSHAELRPAWDELVDLLDHELTFDPDRTPDELLAGAMDDLVAAGALVTTERGWRVADEARLNEQHGLLRGLLESYLLVARAAQRAAPRSIEGKVFLKELQHSGEALLSAGFVTRPEALGAVALKNALDALADRGAVALTAPGRYTVQPAVLDPLVTRLGPQVEGA